MDPTRAKPWTCCLPLIVPLLSPSMLLPGPCACTCYTFRRLSCVNSALSNAPVTSAQVFDISQETAPIVLKQVADKLDAANVDSVTQANTRVALFANCRGVYKALQDIAASQGGQYFPIGLLPLGKSNDVSRVSGWGNVHKQDWSKPSTAPDLVSAITMAPEVKVDYWSVRAASSDRASLDKMPAAFKKQGKDVSHPSSLEYFTQLACIVV
jgi:hypothetical protein